MNIKIEHNGAGFFMSLENGNTLTDYYAADALGITVDEYRRQMMTYHNGKLKMDLIYYNDIYDVRETVDWLNKQFDKDNTPKLVAEYWIGQNSVYNWYIECYKNGERHINDSSIAFVLKIDIDKYRQKLMKFGGYDIGAPRIIFHEKDQCLKAIKGLLIEEVKINVLPPEKQCKRRIFRIEG